MLGRHVGREGTEHVGPVLVEVVTQSGQTASIDPVEAARPHPDMSDQARLPQHPEMLGDSRARYRKLLGDRSHGDRAVADELENPSPGRIPERIQNLLSGGHIGNHTVTNAPRSTPGPGQAIGPRLDQLIMDRAPSRSIS